MSETPKPSTGATDLSGERALIVGKGDVPIAQAALHSMGLRERVHVSQAHTDGEPIDTDSRNRRIGWHQPPQEAVSGSGVGRLDDPGLPVDFEKAELSKRIGGIKKAVDSAPDGGEVQIHLPRLYREPEPPAAPDQPREMRFGGAVPAVADATRQLSGNITPMPPLPPHFPGVNDAPVHEAAVPPPRLG